MKCFSQYSCMHFPGYVKSWTRHIIYLTISSYVSLLVYLLVCLFVFCFFLVFVFSFYFFALHRLFLLLGSRDSLFSRSKVAGLQICQAYQYSSWYKICYSVWEWTGLGVYLATRYLYVKWNTLRPSWLHTYRLHTCIWERYSYYVNKVYNEIFIPVRFTPKQSNIFCIRSCTAMPDKSVILPP
jgi:hypothetical protein